MLYITNYLHVVFGHMFVFFVCPHWLLLVAPCILWSGVLERRIGVEWSQILEWQK